MLSIEQVNHNQILQQFQGRGGIRMRIIIGVLFMLSLVLAGCGNKELEQRNQQLAQELKSKDQFIEEVTTTVNEIHEALESAWAMEKKVVRQTEAVEGRKAMTSAELKQSILSRISDMSSTLSENRKKVSNLESRLRSARTQYAGVTKMVEQLKKDIEEREKAIADLQTRVQNLEGEVAEKTKVIVARETTIAEHETTIKSQRKQMSTVFYTVGTRDELEKKGIIAEEGGVLWGLLGTTTTLATSFDDVYFQPVDRTTETIEVPGAIEEIIPKRDQSLYVKEETTNGHSVLRIVKPEHFWRENRLVVVMR